MGNEKAIERLLAGAPELRDGELDEINALFTPYLFRRRRTREVWASCCGTHGVVPADSPVMLALHTPTPREPKYYGCHMGMMSAAAPVRTPEPAPCPFCGRMAAVKELGRTGRRQNLCEFRRAVVLRQWRGALWGLGFDASKDFAGEFGLTRQPSVHLIKLYRFTAKKAEYAGRYWWGECAWNEYRKLQTDRLMAGWSFPDGFHYCSEYGTDYDLVGLEEAGLSVFRYCGLREYQAKHADPMKFLALCTVYPRQVEMLMKAGLDDIVADFVVRGKRNARIFSWDEPNPMRSFGLPKDELALWMKSGHDTELLAAWKQYRKQGLPGRMEDMLELQRQLGTMFSRTAGKMTKHGVSMQRILNYLERERTKKATLQALAGRWDDYLDAAGTIGLDLGNDVWLLPRGLEERHDRTTRAAALMRKEKKDEAERARELARCRALVKKYTYTDGRWLIRPPVNAAEIVREGKMLHHCVGGYAERHMNGSTTILFLRDRKRPGKPLVTIEIQGSQIRQIHGWDDERTKCKENPGRKDPRKIYMDFLDGWLAWVEAGIRRKRANHKNKKESAA